MPHIVRLVGDVGEVEIEHSLWRHLRPTLQAKSIVFDFSNARYISLFALSLLLVWVDRLTSGTGRQVDIVVDSDDERSDSKFPPDGLLRFFGSWRVWEAFAHVGAKIRATQQQMSLRSRSASADSPYLPFDFYAVKQTWDDFLQGLEDQSTLLELFGQATELQVIGSGGLRSIILEELGKNAFEHGKGKATHIAVGATSPLRAGSQEELQYKLKARIAAIPEYLKEFYSALGNQRCLEIVVSDRGPGIPRTIRKAYARDRIIPKKLERPSEPNLIEYAFLLHSTSKPESWYVSAPDSDTEYQSPRGLFFVKNIASRNRGLLICRSGSGITAWDFLSSESGRLSRAISFKDRGSVRRLAPLGGTQVRLLIPMKAAAARPRKIFPVGKFAYQQETGSVQLVSVARLAQNVGGPTTQRGVQTIVSGMHKAVLSVAKRDVTIFDFLGSRWTKDSLYPVVSELGHLSLDGHIIAVLHTAHFDGLLDEMLPHPENFPTSYRHHRSRPFLRLAFESATLTFSLVGMLDSDTKRLFQELLSANALPHIPESLDHLVEQTANKTVGLRFSIRAITDNISDWRKRILKQMISDPAFGIFHEGKFLLPTSPYVEGFYEIAALLDYPDGVTLLQEAMLEAYREIREQPSTVICITKIGTLLGELLQSGLGKESMDNFVFASRPRDVPRKMLGLKPQHSTVVLIDVIASGSSLGFVVDYLQDMLPDLNIKALSVLDIRQKGTLQDRFVTEQSSVALRALFRKPTVLHQGKPTSWSHKDIHRIDPIEWRPIIESPEVDEILPADNFLRNQCVESDAIRIGHYFDRGNHNHYRVFVVTNKFVKKYRDLIVDTIRKRIESIVSKQVKGNVTHILYPKDSHGVELIAKMLALHLGGPRTIAFDRAGDPRTLTTDRAHAENVVILDSACSSARTVSHLIDAASHLRPSLTCVCVLMSRAPDKVWRFLSNITSYSDQDVSVGALTRIDIPVFDPKACPLCQRGFTFKNLLETQRYPSLAPTLTKRSNELRAVPIDGILETESPTVAGNATYGEIAYCRMVLERARYGTGTFVDLEKKMLEEALQDTTKRDYLILACANEAQYLFDARYGPPADLRANFVAMASDAALSSQNIAVQQAAVEIVCVAAPSRIHSLAGDFAKKHATSSTSIEALLSELVIFAEGQPENAGPIALALQQMHDIIEKVGHTTKIPPDLLPLISGVRRGLQYEVSAATATAARFAENLEHLLLELRRKRGGTHPYLSESLLIISMLATPDDVPRVIRQTYYDPDGGFGELVFSRILPRLAAFEPAFDVIDSDELSYLRRHTSPSIYKDFEVLSAAITSLQTSLENATLTQDDIYSIFYSDQCKAARLRLSRWLSGDSDRFVRLLEHFATDVNAIVESCCNQWRGPLKEIGAHLKEQMDERKLFAYCWPATLERTVSELLRNCRKHAFERGGIRHREVKVSVAERDKFVLIRVEDNGKGNMASAGVAIGRVRETVAAFGGSVEMTAAQGIGVQISLQKTNL